MPELILQSGRRAGRRVKLPAGEVVVGRDEDCKLRLTSADVSRRHCLLKTTAELITVVDLGSRNKTYVNDIAVQDPVPLRPGDRLRVGPFVFQVPGGATETDLEADVAGWLTEEGGETVAPAGVDNDTAFIPRRGADDDTTELRLAAVPSERHAPVAASAPVSAKPAASVDPVVSQAADIIRNYWNERRNSRK